MGAGHSIGMVKHILAVLDLPIAVTIVLLETTVNLQDILNRASSAMDLTDTDVPESLEHIDPENLSAGDVRCISAAITNDAPGAQDAVMSYLVKLASSGV